MVPTVTSPAHLKGETSVREPDRLGVAVARRSAEVRATVPDLELSVDVDAGAALALAEAEGHSITALLVHACGRALAELPWSNAAYRDGRFELYGRVNVGVTVAAEGGVLTPVVLDADRRSPAELTALLAELTQRAHSGELTPPEQAGATFTLWDHSADGGHRWSPLVVGSQAAALAAGAPHPAPVVRDGAVVAGTLMTLTLACDHRILFGPRAGALLTRIAELWERPQP